MTKSEILFNYRQAIRQAERLEEAAGKIDKLAANKMEGVMVSLKSAWQSDSSPQYFRKMNKVQDDIRTDASNIRKVAGSIRATAESTKNAELRALEIAKNRTYN